MPLIDQLSYYHPFNSQEASDLLLILSCLKNRPDVFSRSDRLCHMTASAWTLNPSRSKVLLAYHNIYHSWAWLGGHADGDEDLLRVAMREVQEESGIQSVSPIIPVPFSVEVLAVDGHFQHGEYISSHLHLNVTYLLEADDSIPPVGNPKENSGASWFSPADAVSASAEPWFRKTIYPKLNQKMYSAISI